MMILSCFTAFIFFWVKEFPEDRFFEFHPVGNKTTVVLFLSNES